MEMTYEKRVTVLPSMADAAGRLGVPDTFSLFMDTATEAAGALGVGFEMLKRRGMFWITVKTRIQFIDPPGIMEDVTVSTWPETPGEKRCNRHYRISRNGETLVLGTTEWAIVSVLTGRPQPMAKVLPEGLEYPGEAAFAEPFPRIDPDFPDPPFAEHRVGAVDIDMARHMNNVAYVRAIVNAFSSKEWKKLGVREMTVIFPASAHEGDVLQLRRRQGKGALDVSGALPDGRVCVLARLAIK